MFQGIVNAFFATGKNNDKQIFLAQGQRVRFTFLGKNLSIKSTNMLTIFIMMKKRLQDVHIFASLEDCYSKEKGREHIF
jgi:hypothetical protein